MFFENLSRMRRNRCPEQMREDSTRSRSCGARALYGFRVKVEEFKCQDKSCEHEFEKVIREPTCSCP